jgi:hypothetical protein
MDEKALRDLYATRGLGAAAADAAVASWGGAATTSSGSRWRP